MAGHTPGPWEWRDTGNSTVLWGAHGMRPIVLDCVRAGNQGAKFRVNCDDIMRPVTACSLKVHADTKLIAAAPDLLEALLLLKEFVDQGSIQGVYFDECMGHAKAMDKARAAITRATTNT